MAVVAMNIFYLCTVLGASAAIALRCGEALNRPLPRLPYVFRGIVPPEAETTPFRQTLVRGSLADEYARASEAASAHTRSRSIAVSLGRLGRMSRSWSTMVVAVLAGINACSYLAQGTGAGQWLLPCVGIPLIVAVVNLLGPAKR